MNEVNNCHSKHCRKCPWIILFTSCLIVSVPFRSLCTAVFVAVCPHFTKKSCSHAFLAVNTGELWRNQLICTRTEFHLRFCWRREFPHLLCPHHLSGSRSTEVSLECAMTRTYLQPSRHSIILKFWLEIFGPSHQDPLLLCWCYQFCRNCTLCQRKLAMTL